MSKVLTVGQVNQYIKNVFSSDLTLNHIYIKGEVSNCKYHTSGHIYFTLKDQVGQLACVMFAGQRKGLTFKMEEGQSVVCFGSVSVYERDGKYQLYVNEIVLDGQGVLYEKFERLKRSLSLEGLFLAEHKKKIPEFPHKIGVVTASTGAAVRDIIQIAKRRNPFIQLILYPAIVQGDEAVPTIVRGIKALDSYGVDVIIVGRGGGSIEDLWAFNEEAVARAIYECDTPIISAVGHETDTTIADFVSDMRAPTPSAAAELAVNDYYALEALFSSYQQRMNFFIQQSIKLNRARLSELKLRLEHRSPEYQLRQKKQHLMDFEQELASRMQQILLSNRHKLELYISKLEGLSPLAKLNRGYALVTKEGNIKPVVSVSDVRPKDELVISLRDGRLEVTVLKIQKKDGALDGEERD